MKNIITLLLATALTISSFISYGQTTTSLGQGAGKINNFSTNIGYFAARLNTGNNSTYIGSYSGFSNTTGDANTFLGTKSGYKTTTGGSNVFIGFSAGYFNTTTVGNTFSGYYSGYKNTAHFNTFYGSHSGFNNKTGTHNVMVGNKSGYSNDSGLFNSFMGDYSGYSNTTGNLNTLIGMNAGRFNTTGSGNVFNGQQSGFKNTTGSNNVYLGNNSGNKSTTGRANVYIGDSSARDNITGNGNVFLGYNSGVAETGSNKLYIQNTFGVSGQTPLIYGDFKTKQIGIDTKHIPAGYSLAVKGKVIAEELRIRKYSNWPDYVFSDDYQLTSLTHIEEFIRKNHHLPNIPSAKDIAKKGFNTAEMNAKLLEKIEELTVHLIDINKQVKVLQLENKQLREMKKNK